MTARALIIAAPNSGAGKTTITLGLLSALKRKNKTRPASVCHTMKLSPSLAASERSTFRHGVSSRNRGSDWHIRLNVSICQT